MLRHLFNRAKDEVRFWKACNQFPVGKRAEALALLAGISAHPAIIARATLKTADIQFISGNIPEAIKSYGLFISVQANDVEVRDRNYLLIYAAFFKQESQREIGFGGASQIARGEVIIASKSASYVARNEFPPPAEYFLRPHD